MGAVKRRPILILELMISLSLFGIIMVFLLSSYKDLTLTKKKLREEKEKILGRQKISLRLTQLFSRATQVTQEKEKYLITYDNFEMDESFRGKIHGELFLDQKKRICLVTFSKSGKERREVLATEVIDFTLKFFDEKTNKFEDTYPKQKPFMAKVILDKKVELPLFL